MSRSQGIAMSFSSLYTHVFENVYVTVWTLEQWLRWVFPPFCFSACFSSDAFLFKTVYVCFVSKNEDFMVFSVFPVFRFSGFPFFRFSGFPFFRFSGCPVVQGKLFCLCFHNKIASPVFPDFRFFPFFVVSGQFFLGIESLSRYYRDFRFSGCSFTCKNWQ